MNHELTTRDERLHGLKNRPRLVRHPLLRGEALNTVSSRAAWNRALDERRARLLGLTVSLLALGIVGAAWLFSLLGWIR